MYSEIKFKFGENNLYFFEHSATFWLLSCATMMEPPRMNVENFKQQNRPNPAAWKQV